MRKPLAILPLIVLLAWLPCHGLRAQDAAILEQRAGSTVSEALLTEVERILKNTRATTYQHKTKVDEGKGEYHLDCSGLLCYALKRVAPDHLKAIPKKKGRARALAEDFQAAFEAAPADPAKATHWQRIERLAEAKPGDSVAWRKEPPVPGGSTGHVIILVEAPVKEKDGQFRVVLIDSTDTHHADDVRAETKSGGVGRGTMWFTVDEQGRPASFRRSSREGPLIHMPMAIGRAMDSVRTRD